MSDDYDECLEHLAKWIKTKKDKLYDENIKSPANREEVLEEFVQACRILGRDLLRNLNAENAANLKELGWPPELMECIRQPDIRTVICDEVENWLMRYPFVRSRLHLEELERENSGLR